MTRNALKAAAMAGMWSFAGTFGLALLGFLNDVGRWAADHGRTPFPSTSVLGYSAIAATVALATGVVAAVIRLAQAHGYLPGRPPTYSGSNGDR